MPRRTKEESEATAARVLAVATDLFGAQGYAQVGLDAVAARAGVTRGAVYHHFDSKRGLFLAALTEAQRTVATEVDAAAATASDPWGALEAGCRAFLAASSAPATRRIMLVDAPAVLDWQVWRDQDAASSGQLLDEHLALLQEHGQLVAESVPAVTALLSGAMNEAALWIAGRPDPTAAVDEAWPPLRRLLLAFRVPTA